LSSSLHAHPDTNLPWPSAEAQRHSRRLTDLISAQIGARGGWISFAEFMDMAMHARGLGYYAAGAAKLGPEGDFVTAPGISPLFGRTLAVQIEEVLARTGGCVLELGAGTGALAADLLQALDATGLAENYLVLETSADFVQRQKALLSRRCPALVSRVHWLDAIPAGFSGVMLANEVLDALPVHLVVWREDGIRERGVGWRDGHFAWIERPVGPGALRDAAAAISAAPGYMSEIALAGPALVKSLAASLRAGMLLFIDYGFGRREYYHPQRSKGTLMCHYRHRAHDDPFFFPGLQDVTAHVDFTAVAEAAIDAGLTLLGYATQAQFLVNCGIAQMLSRTPADDVSAYLPLAAGVQKLLSPAEMGELFKVIALGRGIGGPLTGFAAGDKSRLLG
jgi:SAM-dependent MidA family methyltransferase